LEAGAGELVAGLGLKKNVFDKTIQLLVRKQC
jgi:hypothetical protein